MQLDTEIARLKLARDLLAGNRPAKKMRARAAQADTQSDAPSDAAAREAPLVTVVPPVAMRERRNVLRPAAAAHTALTSSVPSGPVAVGAAEVKAMTPATVVAPPVSGYSFLMGAGALPPEQ